MEHSLGAKHLLGVAVSVLTFTAAPISCDLSFGEEKTEAQMAQVTSLRNGQAQVRAQPDAKGCRCLELPLGTPPVRHKVAGARDQERLQRPSSSQVGRWGPDQGGPLVPSPWPLARGPCRGELCGFTFPAAQLTPEVSACQRCYYLSSVLCGAISPRHSSAALGAPPGKAPSSRLSAQSSELRAGPLLLDPLLSLTLKLWSMRA